MVKGLKTEDELDIANSDKSGNGLETADSVEHFDSNKSNYMEAKRTKRHPKRRQHWDNIRADQSSQGARNQAGRGARARLKATRSRSEEPTEQREPQVEL